ncbi:hypothetical protein BXZ70DRAFT_127464 [Cristinia sonorae]|uniref:Uncharacterized protein n=1 Tax=Cristinia sonorae TaxID=1940300 RepID=A0A8K0UQ38_9AGAR|nr:hypothetical protein BXZ70DRAFT_127464 [Cristinia sonorae]
MVRLDLNWQAATYPRPQTSYPFSLEPLFPDDLHVAIDAQICLAFPPPKSLRSVVITLDLVPICSAPPVLPLCSGPSLSSALNYYPTMSDSSLRILWRETKRIRRLRRYESLPVAQLAPDNRPVFVCQECKFSNSLIELCPWCKQPCNVLQSEAAVRKRISAPQMLNETQKDQLQRMQAARVEPAKARAIDETVAAFDITMPRMTTDISPRSRRRTHRNAMAYTIAISLCDDETDDDVATFEEGVGHKFSPSPARTVKTSPLRSPPSPTKTLRRKKRMSVIRQRSSCSLRKRAMLSLPPPLPESWIKGSENIPPIPRKSSKSMFITQVPPLSSNSPPSSPTSTSPEPNVPLGHPSRPLYSAIRKNMSRPSTPSRSPLAESTSAGDLRARGMRSLDLPETSRAFVLDDYISDITSRRPWPVRPTSTGYSLSGEIELRMALARAFEDDDVPAPTAPEKKDLDVKLKSKVKKFGKGLKDLMMLRI